MNRRKRTLPRGWYPYDGKDCKREIESYLEGWSPSQLPSIKGRGGVIPHAGWYFSGKLATRVFASLTPKNKVEVVVLYGGHLSSKDVPRIMTEETYETPLGDIEIHPDFVKTLMKRVDMSKESPNSGDNTIEVQLAMVKYFFPEAKLVGIRSPLSLKAEGLGKEVAEIAKREGISLLAIGSTDLTHYGPNYGFLRKGTGPASVEWVKKENDRGFIDHALKMDAEGLLNHALENDSACSAGAVVSAVATCKALGSEKGVLLDYYTSYDIMPDDSFVGYAGILY
ncbi:MAG TPA: AmmeMemoRadiSam system protein B [Thermodesulfobacteriota bacterium]|nr:AmmeMemoRadiSam system protein B [Thermodesulfobacteriota bacterium]